MKTKFSALVAVILFAALLRSIHTAPAIELKQLAGAAHAYPVMLDLNGKKLGNGEFTQEVEGNLLRIKITYSLGHGARIEEKATFRQRPELTQKEWSWRELQQDQLQRSYSVDFDTGKALARKREHDGLKDSPGQVKIEPGQTFGGFGFALALQNLRDRLVKGEAVQLKAVGFTPKPRVVSVSLSYHGVDRLPMSGRVLRGEHFLIHPEVPAVAKLFVKISDTHIWLTAPPSGFLRWEGPVAEPSDPLVRVDLTAGEESGAAEPGEKK